jgi:hypothetical protein
VEHDASALNHVMDALRTVGVEHRDLYKVLQVRPEADPDVIAAAYKKLMQRHHPDKGTDSEDNADVSEEDIRRASQATILNIAYGVLRDPEHRRAYDYICAHPDELATEEIHQEQSSRDGRRTGPQQSFYVVKGYALGRGLDCRGIRLSDAPLAGFDLREIVLAGAQLTRCDLSGCDLSGADLRGARLRDCNIGTATLSRAYYSVSTRFPTGFDPDEHGLIEHPDSVAARQRKEQQIDAAIDTTVEVAVEATGCLTHLLLRGMAGLGALAAIAMALGATIALPFEAQHKVLASLTYCVLVSLLFVYVRHVLGLLWAVTYVAITPYPFIGVLMPVALGFDNGIGAAIFATVLVATAMVILWMWLEWGAARTDSVWARTYVASFFLYCASILSGILLAREWDWRGRYGYGAHYWYGMKWGAVCALSTMALLYLVGKRLIWGYSQRGRG